MICLLKCEKFETSTHSSKEGCLRELSTQLNCLRAEYDDIRIVDVDKTYIANNDNLYLVAIVIFKDNLC